MCVAFEHVVHLSHILAYTSSQLHLTCMHMSCLTYLLHTFRFRSLVESYMGTPMEEWRALPPWKYSDWMGWHMQGEGKWFYGFNIEQVRL